MSGTAEQWKRYRLKHKPYVIKTCSVCGSEFKQTSNAQKRCDNCRTIICLFCKTPFIPNNSTLNHKYCSQDCKIESQKGVEPEGLKNNRGIKPRIYHLRKREKHGNAFDREWRSKIFERDNFTCQHCWQRGGRLEAHHIQSFKAHPELRYEISNGITLCKPCHSKTDTYGWANYWRKEIAVKRLGQGVLPI